MKTYKVSSVMTRSLMFAPSWCPSQPFLLIPATTATHTEDQLDHLVESIKTHGIYRNVIISQDDYILAGHGVCMAARKAGITEVPCLRVPLDHTDVKAIKLLTADNEVEGLADSDARILTGLLSDIFEADDLLGTGYDKARLEGLLIAFPFHRRAGPTVLKRNLATSLILTETLKYERSLYLLRRILMLKILAKL